MNEEAFENFKKKIKEQTEYYEVVKKQHDYYLFQFENQLFYFQDLSNNKVKGKLFSTPYDDDCNPLYTIQEGWFEIDFENRKPKFFLNDKKGIEYSGKSKNIKFFGEFYNGRYQPEKKDFGSRIIIEEDNQAMRENKTKNKQPQQQQQWLKFNQQISERDLQILELKNKYWVTSSILDSLCYYLNKKSQQVYFSKPAEERKNIKRILFVQSTLVTSFGYYNQAQELIKQEFLEFEGINYQLGLIYSEVGFIVNKSHSHWQFFSFNLKKKKLKVFDSLNFSFSILLIEELERFLYSEEQKGYGQKNFKRSYHKYCKQQKDGYSCGLHVAYFMAYRFYKQFNKQVKYQYNEVKIKKALLNLIKNNGGMEEKDLF